ncbi:transient receptor potential cation channel subfamily V member 5-like [Mya arenaria]|uniref:transient receptor potential cation channel subfamily V member 5-like n=1 Tax=Mya arenaria TaxID=6604 RepID=UPI0022E21D11|nr:transient receptor potential cation channel subfamily V member 5-like [Mya arenaria]
MASSTLINTLFTAIERGNIIDIKRQISDIKSEGKENILRDVSTEGETVLHKAVKMRTHPNVLTVLLEECPDLLCESRQCSELYRGQTALHIAITDGNIQVINTLLTCGNHQGKIKLNKVFSTQATGTRFENTVMLGELPLAVAALTLNIQIFDTLVEFGCRVDEQNSCGDTLFHSLVKYSHLYPEKQADIVATFEHASEILNNKTDQIMSKNTTACFLDSKNTVGKGKHCVWKLKNKHGYNILQLAAKLGRHGIFKTIMEMKNIYCHVNSDDGLFDVELYDVTDIDSLADYSLLTSITQTFGADDDRKEDSVQKGAFQNNDFVENNVPTLELIIDNDPATVFKFIELSPLRYVINRKWIFYRWFFAIWAPLHVLFMIGYTVYATRRSEVTRNETSAGTMIEFSNKIGQDRFVTFYAIFSLVVAGLYLIQETVRIYRGRMPWTLSHVKNCYHNGPLRLVLVLFSVAVIADFVWRISDNTYEDYLLVLALIIGWWFSVFFLRGFQQFSFFTVMIQKVLVGDMFRFSIIIGMELVAFTTGLYIAFRGQTTSDVNVSEYGKLMVSMFKMMFGFTSFDVLFEAPNPWFAVSLYVAFILLTYVLMINSLIAMMSNTCAIVSQNREVQYRVQQLSIILFFESLIPIRFLHTVGEKRDCQIFHPDSETYETSERLFMEVRSLHEVTKSKSRHQPNPETMLETIFHTIKNIKITDMNPFDEEQPERVRDNSETEATAVRRDTLTHIPKVEAIDTENEPPSGKRQRHKKKKKKSNKKDNDDVNNDEEATRTSNYLDEYNMDMTAIDDI